ncbi:MAG TPA: alanine dehydrogenase [Saprospiraceae bacterium]|nr:alanine dehydrogenase [Saprospiraceae bacterium]
METLSLPRTQPEMLAVGQRHQQLSIGIPKETTLQENRVALVPNSVATLTAHGHDVLVESGAGEKSRFTDLDYSEAGAQVVHSAEEVYKAEVILKSAPPTLAEIELMRPGQVIVSPIHLPLLNAEYIHKLLQKRVVALAMEYIRDDVSGAFPVVHAMSEISGISAILIAADLLATTRGGKGVLLGGVAGVPPAKVIILGAGVIAEFATRTALGLGAEVRIFDNNIQQIIHLQNQVGRPLHTSVINPKHLQEQLLTADVAIGAVHSAHANAPMLVSEDIVRRMKPGSVIVDVSIDQGGCFETSEATTHDKPTYERHGVIHYCVPNIPSRVARTASEAISNILTSLLLTSEAGGMHALITAHPGLRNGVYAYRGTLTNTHLGERFQMRSTDLDLLITSDF